MGCVGKLSPAEASIGCVGGSLYLGFPVCLFIKIFPCIKHNFEISPQLIIQFVLSVARIALTNVRISSASLTCSVEHLHGKADTVKLSNKLPDRLSTTSAKLTWGTEGHVSHISKSFYYPLIEMTYVQER